MYWSCIASRSRRTAVSRAYATWVCSSPRSPSHRLPSAEGTRTTDCSRWPAPTYHIARNHPFVDGNKRTALLAAPVFLDINGITIERESKALYELTMGVAEGRIEKSIAAAELERIARTA